MPNFILIEEFHVTISVPERLPDHDIRRIRRTLSAKGFRRKLDRAIRAALKESRWLRAVRIRVSM